MRKTSRYIQTVILSGSLLAGCSATSQTATTVSKSTPTFVPVTSQEDTTTSISFHDWTYDEDHRESRFDFAQTVTDIPEEYYEPCDQPGNIEYFYYDTKDYDDTQAEEDKYAIVYTPYGYDSSKQYDIFYLVHGSGQMAETFFGDEYYSESFKYIVDHMIQNGDMNPMIIVAVSYYDYNEFQWTDDEDAQIVKYFGFEFENDLMPAVEGAYSTYAQSSTVEDLIASRDHRIFGGFSMGGVSTWYRFMDSMPYVRYYLPISGMFEWGPDVSEASEDPLWEGSLLKDSLVANHYCSKDFFIYMATGGYDYAREPLEKQICSMTNFPDDFIFGSPTDENVNCTYGYNPEADHNTDDILPYLYQALPIFSQKINTIIEPSSKGD